MNDMDDILGNPKAFFAASGWCSAYMAPKHLAQIITVLLSQPDPFNSLTNRHVKRPSLDLLILHDAAENSAIAVAMLCFSQLQRQMFAPRGFVSSKLGKQNARWTLNKSLLPCREPHQVNCTPFKHTKYDSWSGSSNVRSMAQFLQDLFELTKSTLQKALSNACDTSHWPWQSWFRECSQANSICMVLHMYRLGQSNFKISQLTHDLDLMQMEDCGNEVAIAALGFK